jgi:hypothetical protein
LSEAYSPEDCSFTAPKGPLTAMAESFPAAFFGVYISAASVIAIAVMEGDFLMVYFVAFGKDLIPFLGQF